MHDLNPLRLGIVVYANQFNMNDIHEYGVVGIYSPAGITSLRLFLDLRQIRSIPKQDLVLDLNRITLEM